MKVWKATFDDPDMGIIACWGTTKKLALIKAQELRQIVPGEPAGEIDVEPVEVPTDKQGLVRWLNMNASTDNE